MQGEGSVQKEHYRTNTRSRILRRSVIGTKVFRIFLLAHSHIYYDFTSLPFEQSGSKLVCNVNILYGNLKSENCQDNAQKSQRNCTFMNSASVHGFFYCCLMTTTILGSSNKGKECKVEREHLTYPIWSSYCISMLNNMYRMYLSDFGIFPMPNVHSSIARFKSQNLYDHYTLCIFFLFCE